MEPAWLQPRIQSQLLLLLAGSLKKSPKARGAGSSEQLCYLCVSFESSSCLEKLVSPRSPVCPEYVVKPLMPSDLKQDE